MKGFKGTLNKLTREYIRNSKRIATLEERNKAIKSEVLGMFPNGVDTQYGKWQVFAEGTRIGFEKKGIEGLVNALIMEGNGEVAKRILQTKTESITSGGVRFLVAKE